MVKIVYKISLAHTYTHTHTHTRVRAHAHAASKIVLLVSVEAMCGVEGGETPRKIDEDNQGKKMQINNCSFMSYIRTYFQY